MENTFNFTVHPKNAYDIFFEEIKKIPKTATIEEINKTIREKMSLILFITRELKNEHIQDFSFYRLRSLRENENIDENKLSEFSYPPNPKMGRANREGEQVFYASGDQHTPFHEKATEIKLDESVVYLSKWGVKKIDSPLYMANFLLGVQEGDANYASMMASGLKDFFEKMFISMPDNLRESFAYGQKLFHKLFTERSQEYYHITSAIAHDILITSFNKKANMPLICYPSVAKDQTAINFAFRKDFADQFLYIKQVDKVIVRKLNEENITFHPISRAIVNDGKLVWADLTLKIKTVEYENALVCTEDNPKHFTKMKIGEELASYCSNCQAKHALDVKKIFEQNGAIEKFYLNNFKNLPIAPTFSDKMFEEFKYFVVAQMDGNVYLKTSVFHSEKVNFVMVPITYLVGFEQKANKSAA